MPFLRNAVFTGREQDLLALADAPIYANEPGRVGITQLIAASGLGGIGKIQLAVQLCWRYGRWFDGTPWIAAANEKVIGTEISACGMDMGLRSWPEKQNEQIAFLLRA
jgi:hypothetical protein